MAAYNSTYTGAQHDAYVTKSALVDLIYPVGAIYMSVNSTSPQTLFGGTWQQIQDTFLLCAGSSHTAGSTGGKAEYVADDMPAHTHTRGTMNITGATCYLSADAVWAGTANGAFSGYSNAGGSCTNVATSGSAGRYQFNFDASRNWTGETSQSGTNTTATIMPPYLAVYVWKRTA